MSSPPKHRRGPWGDGPWGDGPRPIREEMQRREEETYALKLSRACMLCSVGVWGPKLMRL